MGSPLRSFHNTQLCPRVWQNEPGKRDATPNLGTCFRALKQGPFQQVAGMDLRMLQWNGSPAVWSMTRSYWPVFHSFGLYLCGFHLPWASAPFKDAFVFCRSYAGKGKDRTLSMVGLKDAEGLWGLGLGT